MNERLLLVEDDENLGYILKEYLKLNDFKVDLAEDGIKGLEFFKKREYDLCILDVMMPKMDGFSLATELKEIDDNVPFVFLTAKTLKVDKLKGFNIGADDYIVKPVDEELLIARIKTIIRRTRSVKPTYDKKKNTMQYKIGDFLFDYEKRLISRDEFRKILTEREADVLYLLCKEKGNLLEREYALKKIWGESDYFNRRIMDVYISKLRKYFAEDPNVKIENVHGKGFILED